MELNIDMGDLERDISEKTPKEIKKLIKKAMTSVAIEWENSAKRIIQDNSLDTGQFASSVHFEMFEESDGSVGFIGSDAVDYGIYHEYGTIRHFVSFWKWTGSGYDKSQPVLAEWAKRVLGMTEEEMESKKGLMIEIKESKPFTRAMLHAQSEASDIFKETFTEV